MPRLSNVNLTGSSDTIENVTISSTSVAVKTLCFPVYTYGSTELLGGSQSNIFFQSDRVF